MDSEKKVIAIVEDEILIADSLRRNLNRLGYKPVGPATDYEEAIALAKATKPDLLLLDIRLDGIRTGIEVGHQINEILQIPFIYITSHIDKATLDAAKLTNPAGYLTKPFTPESLYSTIEIALHNTQTAKASDEYVYLQSGKTKEKVNLNDIVFVKSEHVYVQVQLRDRRIVLRSSLGTVLDQLPAKRFVQTQRSYAVNISFIQSVTPTKVILTGVEIPISRKYREALVNRLK